MTPHRTFLILAVLAALALSGCATTPEWGPALCAVAEIACGGFQGLDQALADEILAELDNLEALPITGAEAVGEDGLNGFDLDPGPAVDFVMLYRDHVVRLLRYIIERQVAGVCLGEPEMVCRDATATAADQVLEDLVAELEITLNRRPVRSTGRWVLFSSQYRSGAVLRYLARLPETSGGFRRLEDLYQAGGPKDERRRR